MNQSEFKNWFKPSFWKAFKNRTFPIKIPQTSEERSKLVKSVCESIATAQYSPSIPEAEILMDKGYGVTRTVPVFCIEDYCVYYFCIKELEDVLCGNRTENTFGGWSLGGKFREIEKNEIECQSTDYGRYSFNPQAWTKAFGEFNALLFAQLEQKKYSHVLQFDISNFYDSVRLDMLERWIREALKNEKGWIVSLLFYLLNQWNRRNTGLHPQAVGLPQDALADCSRILANFYLQKYDGFAKKICDKVGAMYFRYADDQMILLNNPDKMKSLLLLITRELDRYGLRVNQKKVDLWEAEELLHYRCRSIQAIFAKGGDNKNPERVKAFVDAYLAIPLSELEETWNRGLPLLNRLIYANLESLPNDLFELIVERLTSEQYLLQANHKNLKRVHDLNLRRKEPIDFTRCLQQLGQKHVHNAFHYDVLAFAVSIKDNALKKFFDDRLASLAQQMKGYEIS